jgi:4-hydroxy-tetrahydrodipicolinate reductase
MSTTPITIVVSGACGKVGRHIVRAIAGEPDMRLVAAVDRKRVGQDAGGIAGVAVLNVAVTDDLAAAIDSAKPQVMVDFTTPDAVKDNLRIALRKRVACVVGTTGLTPADLANLGALCREHATPALVAPNFAIGAVLMMEFAAQAAKHFDAAEIIELHHDQKLDAPSGTALRTAEMMRHVEGSRLGAEPRPADAQPARGQAAGALRIHSVRLPGLVAHQEVIFGGLGQTLTLRHDSISRDSFVPGVLVAIRKVRSLEGLTCGLERVL